MKFEINNLESVADLLKQVANSIEISINPDHPVHQEINYWRTRILNENHLSKKLCPYFMGIPSEVFIKKTPEQWIEEIKKYELGNEVNLF